MQKDSFIQAFINDGNTVISNLLLHHYHDIGMSTSELMVFIELRSYIDHGNGNPSVAKIAQHLGASVDQVYDLIQQMVSDGFLKQQLKKNDSGKEEIEYDFTPLINRLERWHTDQKESQEDSQEQNDRQKIFQDIEMEFGRMLNPMEMSLINDWLDRDHYDPKIIKLALRETVLNGKYNFKYMDRILINWRNKNLQTPQEVEAELRRFDEQKSNYGSDNSHAKPSGHHIPIFKLGDKNTEN